MFGCDSVCQLRFVIRSPQIRLLDNPTLREIQEEALLHAMIESLARRRLERAIFEETVFDLMIFWSFASA